MKLTFTDHIKTMTGKCHDGRHVFMSYRNGDLCYKKPYNGQTITANNIAFGAKFQKARALYGDIGPLFKEALKKYAAAYNKKHVPLNKGFVSGYNVYYMITCNKNVTMSDLNSLIAFTTEHGDTLSDLIAGGLLKPVKAGLPSTRMNE